MSTPMIAEQIAAVRKNRAVLEYSYTVRGGKHEGKITNRLIAREVRALRAAEETLKRRRQRPF